MIGANQAEVDFAKMLRDLSNANVQEAEAPVQMPDAVNVGS